MDSTKLLYHVKHEVQTNIADVERANKFEGFKLTKIIDANSFGKSNIFGSIIPDRDGRVTDEKITSCPQFMNV